MSELAAAGRLMDVDGRALEAFEIPLASVRSISARTRRSRVGEDEGVDAASLRRMYAAVDAGSEGDRGCAYASGDRGCCACGVRGRAAAGAGAATPGAERAEHPGALHLDAHRDGPVYTPDAAPPETVLEPAAVEPPSVPDPAPEPKAAQVPHTPGEWMREQVAAFGRPAPAPARRDAHGVCGYDYTLQSFPNPPPRDELLPKVEPERSAL